MIFSACSCFQHMLLEACKTGNVTVVEELLKAGVDPSVRDQVCFI